MRQIKDKVGAAAVVRLQDKPPARQIGREQLADGIADPNYRGEDIVPKPRPHILARGQLVGERRHR